MDINELISSLNADDIAKLRETANSLLGTNSQPNQSAQLPVSGEMLNAVQMLSGKLGGDDERTALLRAIKPLLSEPRQKKADEAIKILRLISIIPVLRESGILSELL